MQCTYIDVYRYRVVSERWWNKNSGTGACVDIAVWQTPRDIHIHAGAILGQCKHTNNNTKAAKPFENTRAKSCANIGMGCPRRGIDNKNNAATGLLSQQRNLPSWQTGVWALAVIVLYLNLLPPAKMYMWYTQTSARFTNQIYRFWKEGDNSWRAKENISGFLFVICDWMHHRVKPRIY